MATRMDIKDQPSDTVLCVSAKIHISAPPSHVFDVLTRGNTWPEWNTFCPAVKVHRPKSSGSDPGDDRFALGDHLEETTCMDPKSPDKVRASHVLVTECTTPETSANQDAASPGPTYRVSWEVMGYPRFLLRTHRTSECLLATGGAAEPTTCEFRTWEYLSGPMAYVVKMMYGQVLQDRFEDWARDLKGYAEKTWPPGARPEQPAED